jgi:hypothetical protein
MTSPGESAGNGDEQLRHIEAIINTLGSEVTGGQEDMDRVMPDAFQSAPEEVFAALQGADYEGVPLPYIFQFVVAANGWSHRLRADGPSPELAAEITTGLRIRESRYPEASGWDISRGHLAEQLSAAGDRETALDVVCGMRSKHEMARTVLWGAFGAPEGGSAAIELDAVVDRLRLRNDDTDLLEFLQASYDVTVQHNPSTAALDTIEAILRLHDPNYDPVQSWAASMAKDVPEVDWEGAAGVISNQGMWPSTTSLRFRQFALASHFEMRRYLDATGPVDDENVQNLLEGVGVMEATTAPAPIWDQFRYAYGIHCLDTGQSAHTLAFGRAMHDPSAQQQLVERMILYGEEDNAIRLAEGMTDARLMAETFLNGDWLKNNGVQQLARIIADETQPLVRRIECLIAMRDRMRETADRKSAEQYDAQLTDLRRRLAEE